jgi:AraC-like DNA-binding protein
VWDCWRHISRPGAGHARQQKDSLLNVIAHTQGDEKLEAYHIYVLKLFYEVKDRASLQYLADVIRETTGETYSAYISGLCLQYALTLLNEQPGMTPDAVAVDSGHGSYSPFFHSFTKKYSITSSKYRKMSAAKNGK